MSASFVETADEAYELIQDRKKLVQYTKDVWSLSASTKTGKKSKFIRDLPYDDIYDYVENIGTNLSLQLLLINFPTGS